MERVIAYVDGFNFYHGLKSKGLRRFYWLNIRALMENILLPDQRLVHVHYFTSRVKSPADKVKRQGTFIEAVQSVPGITVRFGHYVESQSICRSCRATSNSPREKRTDVNIASIMLYDAFRNSCDNMMVVSADTDLIGPLDVVRHAFPNIKRTIAFPPGRHSDHLKKHATGHFWIGEDALRRSVFPDEVKKADGYVLRKPTEWR